MKANDSQQLQSKAPVSSDSAFDQQMGGKTMSPPKFGLEASGGEAAHAADGGGQMPDDEFEALFWKIVAKGQDEKGHPIKDEKTQFQYLANAACFVMDNYGWNRDLIRVRVLEKTKRSWGETFGNNGKEEIQRIYFPKLLFRQDFGLIVRTIGHEYQHAMDATSDNPSGNIYESEFRAYYWELMSKDVIAHRDPKNVKIAKANAIQAYEYMNTDKKKLYLDKYNEILSMK
ncbi:MAG: hypothetical protein RLZZ519_2493 [Bacteroidota bacterium]|jgi:hypothetical protein